MTSGSDTQCVREPVRGFEQPIPRIRIGPAARGAETALRVIEAEVDLRARLEVARVPGAVEVARRKMARCEPDRRPAAHRRDRIRWDQRARAGARRSCDRVPEGGCRARTGRRRCSQIDRRLLMPSGRCSCPTAHGRTTRVARVRPERSTGHRREEDPAGQGPPGRRSRSRARRRRAGTPDGGARRPSVAARRLDARPRRDPSARRCSPVCAPGGRDRARASRQAHPSHDRAATAGRRCPWARARAGAGGRRGGRGDRSGSAPSAGHACA